MNVLDGKQRARLLGWQTQNLDDWEKCRRMQDFAKQHLDLPIKVMGRGWHDPHMLIPMHGEQTIHTFTAMVKRVTEQLGIEPDKIEPHVSESVSLNAEWNINGMRLIVWVYSARGCKIHPDHQPVPTTYGKAGQLHPECQDMLESLT